jgi:uncharacterized protein (TIGR03435 family)
LKIHRSTREVPVYELIVAKGGSKLKPFDGSCKIAEFGMTLTPRQARDAGYCLPRNQTTGSSHTVEMRGSSLEQFTRLALNISRFSDRPVIDKTGITGLFDFHLTFALDPDQPGSTTVLQEQLGDVIEKQLGLQLRPAKGPGDEFLVIDRIERHPSEN